MDGKTTSYEVANPQGMMSITGVFPEGNPIEAVVSFAFQGAGGATYVTTYDGRMIGNIHDDIKRDPALIWEFVSKQPTRGRVDEGVAIFAYKHNGQTIDIRIDRRECERTKPTASVAKDGPAINGAKKAKSMVVHGLNDRTLESGAADDDEDVDKWADLLQSFSVVVNAIKTINTRLDGLGARIQVLQRAPDLTWKGQVDATVKNALGEVHDARGELSLALARIARLEEQLGTNEE